MDWRHRALCRDEDPELFFPIGTTGPALVQIEQAKAVCQRCGQRLLALLPASCVLRAMFSRAGRLSSRSRPSVDPS